MREAVVDTQFGPTLNDFRLGKIDQRCVYAKLQFPFDAGFGREVRDRYLPVRQRSMTIWEAMDYLEQLVDDSDPDTELPQIAHSMQTAEAIRAAGHPDWFIVTGLIHDLGKVLC